MAGLPKQAPATRTYADSSPKSGLGQCLRLPRKEQDPDGPRDPKHRFDEVDRLYRKISGGQDSPWAELLHGVSAGFLCVAFGLESARATQCSIVSSM